MDPIRAYRLLASMPLADHAGPDHPQFDQGWQNGYNRCRYEVRAVLGLPDDEVAVLGLPDDEVAADDHPSVPWRLRLRWWAVQAWFRRCPDCRKRGYWPATPRWDEDKTARMLGLSVTGRCGCCGKPTCTCGEGMACSFCPSVVVPTGEEKP